MLKSIINRAIHQNHLDGTTERILNITLAGLPPEQEKELREGIEEFNCLAYNSEQAELKARLTKHGFTETTVSIHSIDSGK